MTYTYWINTYSVFKVSPVLNNAKLKVTLLKPAGFNLLFLGKMTVRFF